MTNKKLPENGDSVHLKEQNKTGIVVAVFADKFVIRAITGYIDVNINDSWEIIPDFD